jgi:hypothetical protein
MVRRVQCTFPKYSSLAVIAAAIALASCGGSIGGESVTGSPVIESALPALDEGTVGEFGKKSKVLICHKGKDKKVPQSAVNGHLGHGDTLGSCSAATCPCFSVNDINAAAPCAGNLSSQCSTGDPAFLFLTCDAGSTGVLGIYASATPSGGSCSRDDVHGSVSQNGLTNAEYQACVNVIKASGYC